MATHHTRLSHIPAGFTEALALFHRAADRVPAYAEFLSEHGINPSLIQSPSDFAKVPVMTKDNYFRKYSQAGRMQDLLWDGSFESANSFSLTSGSTGERFAFPAGQKTLEASFHYLEMILRGFDLPQQRTLVVNCFTMGLWAAGTFMDHAMKVLQERGWPVHVLSPGLNREEALGAIKKLAPYFDQVLICAYPTAAVKLVNEGTLAGFDWSSIRLRFLHGGDAFNESFREGLLEAVQGDTSNFSVINLYASSEVYLVGYETPATILLRRQMAQDPQLAGLLPGNQRQPSVQQYDPKERYLEAEDGKLVLTAESAMPFIRYNTGDDGGVWSFEEVAPQLIDGLTRNPMVVVPKWPMVYVYGRGIKTVTIWALNIYPEHIEAALEDPRVRPLVTRNYRAQVVRNDALEEVFELEVELAPGQAISDAQHAHIGKVLLSVLTQVNAEYAALVRAEGASVHPLLTLCSYGDPRFVPGAKTKVVTK